MDGLNPHLIKMESAQRERKSLRLYHSTLPVEVKITFGFEPLLRPYTFLKPHLIFINDF